MINTTLARVPTQLQISGVHGYGVFASTFIPADTIVEECPVVIVAKKSLPSIASYLFNWDEQQDAMPLGNGMCFNHSEDPNLCYLKEFDKKLLIFKTLRDIKPGEELFIGYGATWFKYRKMKPRKNRKITRWFNRKIKPLFDLGARFFHSRIGDICLLMIFFFVGLHFKP